MKKIYSQHAPKKSDSDPKQIVHAGKDETLKDLEDDDELLLKTAKDWEAKLNKNLNRRDGSEEEPRRKTLDWGVGGKLWTKEDIKKETIRECMSYIRQQNLKFKK